MLLLRDSDVATAIHGSEAIRSSIDLIERCFVDLAAGTAASAPRIHLMYPPSATKPSDSKLSLHAGLGMSPELDAIGGRIFTSRRNDDHQDEHHRQWKLLWDFETLELTCLMEDRSVHPYLVGAHVGVATRHLARKDASIVAVLGSSRMAWGSLRAISAVREVSEVRVFSPNIDNRRRFASDMTSQLGVPVTAADTAEEGVRGADIVSVATDVGFRGTGPALSGAWLSPGTHVNSIAVHELDEATYESASVVPAHLASVLATQPRWEPFVSLVERGGLGPDSLRGDLSELVAGSWPGRVSDDEITLYVGPSLGVQHAAMAAWVCQMARAKGLGVEWDLDDGSVTPCS